MEHLNSIVVATDFSPGSDAAVAQAIRLAKAAGAKLNAVHAINARMMADARQVESGAERPSIESVIEAARERVEERYDWATILADLDEFCGLTD